MCFKTDSAYGSFIDENVLAATSLVRSSVPDTSLQPVYSPASLLILLCSLFASRGPQGITQTEMQSGLSLMVNGSAESWMDHDQASIHVTEYYYGLGNRRDVANFTCKTWSSPSAVNQQLVGSFCIGNLLLHHDNFKLESNFKSDLENYFKFNAITYNNENKPSVVKQANDYVSTLTQGRINNFLGVQDLAGPMVLLNTIFVQSNWQDEFYEDSTVYEFEDRAASKTKIKMLSNTKRYPYFEDASRGFRAVQVPFQNDNELVFMVFLPIERMGSIDISYTGDDLMKIKDRMRANRKINLRLPSFSARSEIDLVPGIKKAGINSLFDPKLADLGGVSEAKVDLYVKSVKQVATFELTKKGIVATTATAMSFMTTSYDPSKPVDFICDQPFLYVLLKRDYSKLLFVGEYNAPDPAYDGFSQIIKE